MEGEEGLLDKVPTSETKTQSSAESVKTTTRSVIKPTVSSSLKVSSSATGSTRKKIEPRSISNMVKSSLTKPTIDNGSTSATSNAGSAVRRNSTGSLLEKQHQVPVKKHISSVSSAVGRKTVSSTTTEPVRQSLPELRRSSLPYPAGKASVRASSTETKNSVPSSPTIRTPRTVGSNSETNKGPSFRTSTVKSSSSLSSSSRVPSTSIDSTGSSTSRKTISKLSSSAQSSVVSSGSKSGSLSSSRERMSTASSLRKAGNSEIKFSRLIMLPHVEVKAGDDVRLDLRGHRIRSLKAGGLNLSPSLEFVYLRDNQLSSLEGIDVLKRVKVLDLSFNDFKGPGFEPLEACKSLQQLYLAGNQITSLKTLPTLPNLEFLSVAQNKLKSLSMASQPQLQVLAASKNKVSTLKGFPCLPSLEHLRLEENPILELAHVEAASILLVGPTLKKFNDRGHIRQS